MVAPPVQTLSPSATPSPTSAPTPSPTPLPSVRLSNGDQALFYGDWQRALNEYQAALKYSEEAEIQATALLGIARAYWMGRNLYETNRALESLLTNYPLVPERVEALFLLAQVRSAQERYQEAVDAYTQYLEIQPTPLEAYIYERRGDAHLASAQYLAAAQDFQTALQAESRLDTLSLRLKMGRAYALAQDYSTALAIYEDALNLASEDNTRALIHLRRAEALKAMGRTQEAIDSYKEAVYRHPTAYSAYLALVALLDAGIEVDELQRGIVDYYAGQYGPAQAAFDRYLQRNPQDPGTAYYFYGLTARKLGHHETALRQWDRLIQSDPNHPYWDEAWDEKAYTQWAFLKDYEGAVQTLLEFIEKAPTHPRAAEFLFDAGLIAERNNQLLQAAQIWDRLARGFPQDSRAPRALFLMGIALYRQGDVPLALDSFQRHYPLANSPQDRAAAQFWIGKCYQALNENALARLAWEKAAEIDPTGYYSERALDMLYQRPPFDPPLSYTLTYDLASERRRAAEWLRTTFSIPASQDINSLGELAEHPALKRGEALWRLGLYDEGRAEWEALRLDYLNDPLAQYRLTNYFLEKGAYRLAIMAARQVLNLAALDDAATLNAPLYFNHVRFGLYFSDLVLPLARQHGFHPLFVYSVIRQESLFEAFARSSAGASGLMQLIPSTAEDMARRLAWPPDFTPEDLRRPMVNLTLGMEYLSRQREAFDGNLYAALAAYNGGPENARQWYLLAPDDPDLFLEVIRYAETRDYIRGVYELFNLYRRIYERLP